MGILGASTDNGVGIAGMTWKPYLLPVRALGKCGGYDSDIITGMQWAAGMPITGVPNNPYPADIINLSLGGSGPCPSDYAAAIETLTGMGVLIVASAGNGSVPPATAAVDAPANCTGVLGVAGLVNALAFHRWMLADALKAAVEMPRSAKMGGAISLALWVLVMLAASLNVEGPPKVLLTGSADTVITR